MEKIASFNVNHIDLLTGIYVSRKDSVGDSVVTTFDLRFTRPNTEPVMVTAGVHTIEHLGATFLRNHPEWKKKVIYFGPMGCRTGFYMILAGDYKSEEVVPLVREMIDFIVDFEGDIPGAGHKDTFSEIGGVRRYGLKIQDDVAGIEEQQIPDELYIIGLQVVL